LGTDCGLREMELFTGPCDAAFAGHHPKIIEVVIIEPIHGIIVLQTFSVTLGFLISLFVIVIFYILYLNIEFVNVKRIAYDNPITDLKEAPDEYLSKL
jgi:hypothetical protein